jgi:hypothetical protein
VRARARERAGGVMRAAGAQVGPCVLFEEIILRHRRLRMAVCRVEIARSFLLSACRAAIISRSSKRRRARLSASARFTSEIKSLMLLGRSIWHVVLAALARRERDRAQPAPGVRGEDPSLLGLSSPLSTLALASCERAAAAGELAAAAGEHAVAAAAAGERVAAAGADEPLPTPMWSSASRARISDLCAAGEIKAAAGTDELSPAGDAGAGGGGRAGGGRGGRGGDDELPSAEALIARRSAAVPPSSIIRLKSFRTWLKR